MFGLVKQLSNNNHHASQGADLNEPNIDSKKIIGAKRPEPFGSCASNSVEHYTTH